MFTFTIFKSPVADRISGNFNLPRKNLYPNKSSEIVFLVRIAREMSQKLRAWLGKYATDGKVEIRNIERDLVVKGHVADYRIIKPLDRGAMATIFEAEEINTGRRLVLKSLSGLQDKIVVRRFIREARILASLNHPNIVSAHDLSSEVQMPFIVMEQLTGLAKEKQPTNFKYLAKQFHKGEIDLRTMLYYIADVCEALDYLHTHPEGPIIHRDLKPSNILVSKEKAQGSGPERLTVKLVDFGLSRISGGSLTTLTHLQQIIGTPAYIPLQDMYNADGEDRTEARLDVYSMGVITYLTITNGLLPFRVQDSNLLKQGQSGFSIVSPLNAPKSDTPITSRTRADVSKSHEAEIQQGEVVDDDNRTIDHPDLNVISEGNPIMALLKMHSETKPDFSRVRNDIPSSLIELTRRMLAKHPEDRPHAREVSREMRRIGDLGKNLYLPLSVLHE